MTFKTILCLGFLGCALYLSYLMPSKTPGDPVAICAYRSCPVSGLVNHCLNKREEYTGNQIEYIKKLKNCILTHRRACHEACKFSRLHAKDLQEIHDASDDGLRFDLINFNELFDQAVDPIEGNQGKD